MIFFQKYLFILTFQVHIHYKPRIKNIMHPVALEMLVVFFPGISVSITIIYFAHINRPKQPGILVLSCLSNHISPNKKYIYP